MFGYPSYQEAPTPPQFILHIYLAIVTLANDIARHHTIYPGFFLVLTMLAFVINAICIWFETVFVDYTLVGLALSVTACACSIVYDREIRDLMSSEHKFFMNWLFSVLIPVRSSMARLAIFYLGVAFAALVIAFHILAFALAVFADVKERISASDLMDDDFSLLPAFTSFDMVGWRMANLEDCARALWGMDREKMGKAWAKAFERKEDVSLHFPDTLSTCRQCWKSPIC
jgi:hypothetical protein